MIDPFPVSDEDNELTGEGLPLMLTAGSLITAVRGETMFKEKEIRRAVKRDNMEKFMIRPERNVLPHQKFALATATLGSFGGMLDRKIRLHDFQLGGLNCKYFLENAFCIPKAHAEQNPIFASQKKFLNKEMIPIIPVVGKAAKPIAPPLWPVYGDEERSQHVEAVLEAMKKRISLVIDIFMENADITKDVSWWCLKQQALNQASQLVKCRIFERLRDTIRQSLENSMSVYADK